MWFISEIKLISKFMIKISLDKTFRGGKIFFSFINIWILSSPNDIPIPGRLSAPKDFIAEIAYGSAVTFGGREIVSFTDIVNTYEDDGGDLNEIENGQELKQRLIDTQEKIDEYDSISDDYDDSEEKEQLGIELFGDGNPNSSATFNSILGSFKTDIQTGKYSGFAMKDLDLEMNLTMEESKRDLSVMLADATTQNLDIQDEVK